MLTCKYGAGGEIFGLALGAVLAAFIALSYAELASKFPRAGSEIVFDYLAFNRTVGFLAGWLLIGAYISSTSFYVTAAGMLLSDIFSIRAYFMSSIPTHDWPRMWVWSNPSSRRMTLNFFTNISTDHIAGSLGRSELSQPS